MNYEIIIDVNKTIKSPISLYESKESNGSVSLIELFNNPNSFDGCISNLTIDKIIFAICRGGWEESLNTIKSNSQLKIVKELYNQICSVNISSIDNIKRNSEWTQTIIQSYSKHICTLTNAKTILKDANSKFNIGKTVFYQYVSALEKLNIIEDINAWCPAIRAKTVIRSSKKRNLIDPSIAVAALGLSPEYFNTDFKTLGFLFESLCIRDLKIYSSSFDGDVCYYHDRYGLEADGVLRLNDGRYALIEFKLGSKEIEMGAKHLCEIERLIIEHNKVEKQCPIRLPDLKIVITGSQYGYKRDDGVFIIPIGCLKN